MRHARRMALACALAVALGGCGADGDEPAGTGSAPRSDRLVDFSKDPPYVNALDIDPADGDFLLTTNTGFWRIDPESGAVERVRGTIVAGSARAPVGTFLELLATGPGRLIGSGHPDRTGPFPSFLGFIRSDDAGRTWRVVARLGDADLHKIVERHGRLYAFDAVLGAILISPDGGRTFQERFTPRGLIIDFEVDPEDPDHLVAANAQELFASTDGGARWLPLDAAEGARLAWPAPGALFRATADGTVERSADGSRWETVGRVPGEPYKFKAESAEHLYLALSDGTIMETRDGGRRWEAAFRP
jgi:hypothetical protein